MNTLSITSTKTMTYNAEASMRSSHVVETLWIFARSVVIAVGSFVGHFGAAPRTAQA